MTVTWYAGRAAVSAGMSFLQNAGYKAEKLTGTKRRFDLIGWKEHKTLCVVVRTSKRFTCTSFPEEIAILTDMVRSGSAPGEVQFWIYRRPGWSMYRIHPGGAILFDWRQA